MRVVSLMPWTLSRSVGPAGESRSLLLSFPAHSQVLKTDPFGPTIGVTWQILPAGGGVGDLTSSTMGVSNLHVRRCRFRKTEKICMDAGFFIFSAFTAPK